MRPSHASHVWLFAFVDTLLVFTFVLCAFTYLVLPQINPKAENNPTAKPPGDLMVCIFWQGFNDVDLWLGAPTDKPVGYSRKNGKVFDLVRDDLGMDNVKARTECQFARGLPDGRYAVDLHGYQISDPTVSVHVEIRMGEGLPLLLGSDLEIRQGQERTAAQFRLLDGKVVPGSINSVYVPLRSAT